MPTVAVIDYGMGNIRSVSKALEHVGGGIKVDVTYDPAKVLHADHVVLPGVGALRDCISELQRLELDAAIREAVETKPFLGVCLGMQALLDHSEENEGTGGLGLIAGEVRRFRVDQGSGPEKIKVPHMGWNRVHQSGPHRLWRDIPQDSYYYFVHSYFVALDDPSIAAGSTDYGISFTSALAKDNVFAVQFHPEKSQQVGLKLLANFLDWDGG